MQTLWQDLRFGVRMFLKQPSFTLIAVLTLALSIGATTTVFSVMNTLVFRSLPFKDAESLVWIANTESGTLSGQTSRVGNFQDWRENNQSFADLAAYFAFSDYGSFTLTGNGEPERLVGFGVTQNFLPLLGVEPLLGRNFTEAEALPNSGNVVLLGHGFWRQRFGGNTQIVGQTITLNERPYLVAGVLPPTFDFAATFVPGQRVDLLSPFPLTKGTDDMGNTLAVIGRLKPGKTIQQGQLEFDALNRQLIQAHPERGIFGSRLTGLQQQINGGFKRGLWLLFGAVGCVLLIACVNLSNLMLVRAAGRRKELAVRLALGASRGRILRQLLTESLLLSACGALLGYWLAQFLIQALASTNSFDIPLLATVTIDRAALLFTLAVTLGTGLLTGLASAWQSASLNVQPDLQDAARGSSATKGRLREALVIAEIALACVLLVGAGLLLRSFWQVLQTDPGFRPEQTAVWRIEPGRKYDNDAKINALYDDVTEQIAALPGVVSVGFTDSLPLSRNRSWGLRVKGQVYRENEWVIVIPRMIDSGYLSTMGIALKAGRGFTKFDNDKSELVMVVNEALAHRMFPGQDPVGRLVVNGNRDFRVVGVVKDVRHSSLEKAADPEMYFPLAQQTENSVEMVVRTNLPITTLAPAVRQTLQTVDANLPVREFHTLSDLVAHTLSPRRFVMLLLSGFAALALVLAVLGIYGVISFSVAQRTQEFGIRLALGAQVRDIVRLVLGRSAYLIGVGLACGLLAALALSQGLRSLLYGVNPTDPLTFFCVASLLAATALFACYWPARRATKVDPMIALRSE